MQSVSDDDVRKRLYEKPRFEMCIQYFWRIQCHEVLSKVSVILSLNPDNQNQQQKSIPVLYLGADHSAQTFRTVNGHVNTRSLRSTTRLGRLSRRE